MVNVDLVYALAALALFASLAWHIFSERTATLRHQVLELAAIAARRERPISDLLQAAARSQRHRAARVFDDLAEALDAGLPFSEALAEAPHHFPADLRHAIAAAEGGPRFAAVIEALATEADVGLTAAHRRHLALAYPLLLAVALVACWEVTAPMFGALATAIGSGAGPTAARSGSLASSMLGSSWIGRMAPSLVLAVLAIAYLWILSVASRTRWGQRVLGRARDLLDGTLLRLSPGRRRHRRARLLGVLAQAVRTGTPLHEALDLGARSVEGSLAAKVGTAADLARTGATAFEVWNRLGLSPGSTLRLASARTGDRLADTLGQLAGADETALHMAHERWLQRIPVLAVCLFGVLVADHFAALMHCIEAAREAAQVVGGGKNW